MKLKLLAKNAKNTKPIKVTDYEGNSEIFESIKAAAKALDVNMQTLYSALCYNKKVRGCTLTKLDGAPNDK